MLFGVDKEEHAHHVLVMRLFAQGEVRVGPLDVLKGKNKNFFPQQVSSNADKLTLRIWFLRSLSLKYLKKEQESIISRNMRMAMISKGTVIKKTSPPVNDSIVTVTRTLFLLFLLIFLGLFCVFGLFGSLFGLFLGLFLQSLDFLHHRLFTFLLFFRSV